MKTDHSCENETEKKVVIKISEINDLMRVMGGYCLFCFPLGEILIKILGNVKGEGV
jgi:hypothetical protein